MSSYTWSLLTLYLTAWFLIFPVSFPAICSDSYAAVFPAIHFLLDGYDLTTEVYHHGFAYHLPLYKYGAIHRHQENLCFFGQLTKQNQEISKTIQTCQPPLGVLVVLAFSKSTMLSKAYNKNRRLHLGSFWKASEASLAFFKQIFNCHPGPTPLEVNFFFSHSNRFLLKSNLHCKSLSGFWTRRPSASGVLQKLQGLHGVFSYGLL